MSDRETLKRDLRKAARRREKASAERKAATEDLRRLCVAGKEAGVPISWIASEAGLSRQGVYDLLAERSSS